MKSVVLPLAAAALSALWPAALHAGPNSGGALLVHCDPTLQSSASCESLVLPSHCADLVSNAPETVDPVLWFVVAVFEDSVASRLRAVNFGLGDYDEDATYIAAAGPCTQIADKFLEIPTANWPGPNSGTSVFWAGSASGRMIPVYWFLTYTKSPGTVEITEHPVQAGNFVNDDVAPAVIDSVVSYGTMGFGKAEGSNECP